MKKRMTKKDMAEALEIACQTLANMDALCVSIGAIDDKNAKDAKAWMDDILETMMTEG